MVWPHVASSPNFYRVQLFRPSPTGKVWNSDPGRSKDSHLCMEQKETCKGKCLSKDGSEQHTPVVSCPSFGQCVNKGTDLCSLSSLPNSGHNLCMEAAFSQNHPSQKALSNWTLGHGGDDPRDHSQGQPWLLFVYSGWKSVRKVDADWAFLLRCWVAWPKVS